VTLAFTKRFSDKGAALRYELALKRRSHAEKGALCRRWRVRRG